MNEKTQFKTKEDVEEFLKIKKPNFKTDHFEEMIMQDLFQSDDSIKVKLHRDLSKDIDDWIKSKLEKKENVSLNIKGSTRSGKSLVGLKIARNITKFYNKPFDTEYITCANQKEFRQKLQNANFGDVFVIDENVFSDVGIGTGTERQQLKDIQNIVAKQNIHTIYITPRHFLPTGAEIGLAYWGKDSKNWLSRFLVYHLKSANPYLLGYTVLNVGELFKGEGCAIYKYIGGCTNPHRYKTQDIPKKIREYSSCIEDINASDDSLNACPFYNVCNHPMVKYEHKKDSWIKKEMEGGLDERQQERYFIALGLIKKVMADVIEDEDGSKFIRFTAKSGKDLWNKISFYIPKLSSTKLTQQEQIEIFELIKSFSQDNKFLTSILEELLPNITFDEYIDTNNTIDKLKSLNKEREDNKNNNNEFNNNNKNENEDQ